MYLSVCHFSHLEEKPFAIQMDYQPLVHAFSKSQETLSSGHQGCLFITQLGCTITHIPSGNKPVADTVTHIQIALIYLDVDKTSSLMLKKETQRPLHTAPLSRSSNGRTCPLESPVRPYYVMLALTAHIPPCPPPLSRKYSPHTRAFLPLGVLHCQTLPRILFVMGSVQWFSYESINEHPATSVNSPGTLNPA